MYISNNFSTPKIYNVTKQSGNISFHGNLSLAADKFERSVSKKNITNPISSLGAKLLQSLSGNSSEISSEGLEKLFLQNNFRQDKYGRFYKVLSADESTKISKMLNKPTSTAKEIFKLPVSKEVMKDFCEFLNIGNNFSFAKKNFNETFALFSDMYENMRDYDDFISLLKKNPDYIQLVQNLITNSPKNSSIPQALTDYKKLNYTKINNALRTKSSGGNSQIVKEIKEISDFLETQKIKTPIKLYRGEGLETLSKAKLENGQTVNLAAAIQKAAKSGNQEEINKIRKYVQNHNITVHQDSFLSTSMLKDVAEQFAKESENGKAFWILSTKPNTKGVYMETLNQSGKLLAENEVLLQKGSDMTIKDVNYVNGVWKFLAEVSN